MVDIQTSIHGSRLGLSQTDELVVNGKVVAESPTAATQGAAPTVTGLKATVSGNGVLNKVTLSFTDVDVAMLDNAGTVAYAGLKVFDFAEGAVNILGAVADLDVTKSSAGINDTFDGDFGVGTVTASDNATLATTEQNIIPTTATPQAAAGATTANGQSTAGLILDGTTTAVDVFLNFLIDDADHNVTGTPANLILNGTLTFYFIALGDY